MSSGLDFEGWQLRCTLLLVKIFALKASSYCNHDMGALLWLNPETLERMLIPLSGRLVRYLDNHLRTYMILAVVLSMSCHLGIMQLRIAGFQYYWYMCSQYYKAEYTTTMYHFFAHVPC